VCVRSLDIGRTDTPRRCRCTGQVRRRTRAVVAHEQGCLRVAHDSTTVWCHPYRRVSHPSSLLRLSRRQSRNRRSPSCLLELVRRGMDNVRNPTTAASFDAAAHGSSSTVSSIRVRGGEVRDPGDRAVDRCRTTVNQCRNIKPLVESTPTRIGREGLVRPSNTAASLWCTLPVFGPAFRSCAHRQIWGRRLQRTCGKAPMPLQGACVLSCSGKAHTIACSAHRCERKRHSGEIFGDHPEPLRHLHIGRGGGAAHERRISTRP
jgi:hypothetical protein